MNKVRPFPVAYAAQQLAASKRRVELMREQQADEKAWGDVLKVHQANIYQLREHVGFKSLMEILMLREVSHVNQWVGGVMTPEEARARIDELRKLTELLEQEMEVETDG